jgi:RNA polymerase sigma factor (sigma-70 family)
VNLTPEEAARLVGAAAGGDSAAWERLVDAYSGLIWTVARNHRLDARDTGDVCQTTWLRLVEHIDRLSEPGRVASWLVTTARRESLRIKARSRRTVLIGDPTDLEAAARTPAEPEVDANLLRAEQERVIREALEQLPDRQQELMRMLMADPAPSYEEVSATLGMPVGRIGPTRMRCLTKLRRLVDTDGIEVAAARSS